MGFSFIPANYICSSLKFAGVVLAKLVLTTVILVTIPIQLLINIYLISSRSATKIIMKLLYPSLGKMVTTRGQILASDEIYIKPKANVVVMSTFVGDLDINELRDIITKNVLYSRLPDGNLRYPELKQCLVNKMGYYFWKDDKAFDLANHVKLYEDGSTRPTYSDNDVDKIRADLLHQIWSRKKPLWEAILLSNYYPGSSIDGDSKGPCSALFLVFHHTLGDGYSWLSLVTNRLLNVNAPNAVPSYPKRSWRKQLFYYVKFLVVAAFEWASMTIESMFKTPFDEQDKSNEGFNVCMSNLLSIRKIKDIKCTLDVSFASVVFACVTGALRHLLLQKGVPVPSYVKMGIALPLPDHSKEKLRNYATCSAIKLVTGDPNPETRLRRCHKAYIAAKKSTLPHLFTYLSTIMGCHTSWILKLFGNTSGVSLAMTIFPFGYEYWYLDGKKCVDLSMAAGARINLVFGAMSYVDGMRISITAKASVLSHAEVKDLAHLVEEQIDILHDLLCSPKQSLKIDI